jgi:hypothetical protein
MGELKSSAGIRIAGIFTIGTAIAFFAVWLWTFWCEFPAHHPLNDMRTAAAVGLHLGFSPYSTPTSGIVTTWIYGPVTLFVFLPAGWAPTAAGSLQISGAINLLLIIAAVLVAVVHFGKTTTGRLLSLLAALALWPKYSLNIVAAEHVAILLAILGVVLMERGSLRWAAVCAVLALFSKQTAIGIPLAQLIWMYQKNGVSGLRQHLLRLVACILPIGGLFIARFGFPSLWHSMVVVPGALPWTPNLHWQLVDDGPYLVAALLTVIGSIVTCRSADKLVLPALTCLCLFPLAAATVFKVGGGAGALDVCFVWLAPALSVGVESILSQRTQLGIGFALTVSWYVQLSSGRLAIKPVVQRYDQATYLAQDGRAWFPLNPLITLYSAGRYNPDEDGLYERQLGAQPVSSARLRAALPKNLVRVVYPAGSNTWGIAMRETGSAGRMFGSYWLVVTAVERP